MSPNNNVPTKMNNVTSPIIEKVRKLLALSQSDNANERDQALARANALIATHNIDMALVSAEPHKPEAYDAEVESMGRRKPAEANFIAWILQNHFRVKIVFSHRYNRESDRRERTLNFIGRKSDAEFARWLYSFLREEFVRRWHYYRKSHNVPVGERNTYLYGLYEGLNKKLKEEAAAAESNRINEIAQAGTTTDGIAGQAPTADQLRGRYALVMQDEKASLDAEMRRRFPTLSSSGSRIRVRQSGSLDAGRAAGRTISCNRPLSAAA